MGVMVDVKRNNGGALCYLPPVEYIRLLLTEQSLGGNTTRNQFCGIMQSGLFT